VLEEAAEDLVKNLLPPWSQETRISQIVDAMAHFDSYGITSAISARVDPADMRAHQIIARNSAATLRMTRKDINGTLYGAAQAVSREEALRLYISSAAHYAFAAHKSGSIEPGKLADLAILSGDPLTAAFPALKRRHCGASQCASNFGLKFASDSIHSGHG
jgi:predicted amidohydrolase YtcJ